MLRKPFHFTVLTPEEEAIVASRRQKFLPFDDRLNAPQAKIRHLTRLASPQAP